jgi:hypothetical protein
MKYGCEVFKIRNNFPYENFSGFEMDFELKFRKPPGLNLKEI